jgi:protein-L-isoaspartate O-methyltransferase
VPCHPVFSFVYLADVQPTIPPALLEQLASPGRMIIPVGTYYQRFVQVDKDVQGKITQKDLFGVVVSAVCFAPTPPRLADFSPFCGVQYVPLTDRPE